VLVKCTAGKEQFLVQVCACLAMLTALVAKAMVSLSFAAQTQCVAKELAWLAALAVLAAALLE